MSEPILTLVSEVLDKMPGPGEVWMWALAGGLLCCLAARWKWWLIALAPLASMIVFAMTGFADAAIGPLIERESPDHALATLPAVALPLIGGAIGLFTRSRSRRKIAGPI